MIVIEISRDFARARLIRRSLGKVSDAIIQPGQKIWQAKSGAPGPNGINSCAIIQLRRVDIDAAVP